MDAKSVYYFSLSNNPPHNGLEERKEFPGSQNWMYIENQIISLIKEGVPKTKISKKFNTSPKPYTLAEGK